MVDNVSFLAGVDIEMPALVKVKAGTPRQEGDRVLAGLIAHFRVRPRPTFFFDAQDGPEIMSLVRKDKRTATINAADEICTNTFDFRGSGPITFRDKIDWTYRPQGNIDWTWDLNRHAYFETLGRAYWYTQDERYALKFREILLDWSASNPASVNQFNWSSVFEVAFRINTWIWAFHYFRPAAAFDDEASLALLKGLLIHGRFLNANLELHVPNNHLLLEAKALALLGILFPEFKDAKRWRQRGLSILERQVQAQVCADGVHAERATHYHRVIAGELLELLVLMENNSIPISSTMVDAFSRMVEFELWITKPNGVIPLFGDSALEDTYLRFPAATGGAVFLGRNDLKSVVPPMDEAIVWLLGHRRIRQFLGAPAEEFQLNSRAFSQGGYIVMRAGKGPGAAYLAFDCGPFGHRPVPSHGHADALSFELYAHGQTLVVDPGVYSTQLGQDWRNFFRGTRAHNTVVVDDQDQSVLMDIRGVHRPARATLHQWITNDQFDFVDGSQNGYQRLSEPITHRRQVFFVKPEYWVIIDLLLGRGKHCFDLYFHLLPGIEPQLNAESGAVITENGKQPGLAIVPLTASDLQAEIITGATNPIQGWVSFYSGKKQPASTVRYRQVATAPLQICTVLYPYPLGDDAGISVSPLELKAEGLSSTDRVQVTSLQIETSKHLDFLVIDRDGTQNHKTFAEYESDAHLAYVRRVKDDNNNNHKTAFILGGHRILFQGQPITAKRSDHSRLVTR